MMIISIIIIGNVPATWAGCWPAAHPCKLHRGGGGEGKAKIHAEGQWRQMLGLGTMTMQHKALEGTADIHTDTISPLYDDLLCTIITLQFTQ